LTVVAGEVGLGEERAKESVLDKELRGDAENESGS